MARRLPFDSHPVRIVGSAAYLTDRARRRGSIGLFSILSGIVIIALGFVAAQAPGTATLMSGFPAFMGFGAIVVGVLYAARARKDAEGAAAEGPLLTQLRARLSDDYLYLRRVSLPGQNSEADAVLLGPHGALVLGLHGAPGTYTVRGDDWFGPSDSPLRHSPTWRLARPLRTLQRLVRQEGLTDLPVNGAVVLSAGELAGAEQPSVAVVPVSKIASYVEYLRAADPLALRAPVQQLAEMLTPLASGGRHRRKGPRAADGAPVEPVERDSAST
ncbi:MAG: NERD domain-containing protein [Chloroflexota bacterium]